MNVVDTTPNAFKRNLKNIRINICRSCTYFIPTTWFCFYNKQDCRKYSNVPINICPLPIAKW